MYFILIIIVFFSYTENLSASSILQLPKPLVIAHRGASGSLPEHTLEAYSLAIEQGAHFIEPDLVSTRDGVLVARHENEISKTTNVSEIFPDRYDQREVDGKQIKGWFIEDFSLVELKRLKARERLAFRSQEYNDRFEIPTLDEILSLLSLKNKEHNRKIGLYPETKHSTYFRHLGLPLEENLVRVLSAAGLNENDDWVFIQSFEVENLKMLKDMTDLRLVQLIGYNDSFPYDQINKKEKQTYGQMVTNSGLNEIAQYATLIGVPKSIIIPYDENGRAKDPTNLIERAHGSGLGVHVYTFRNEPRYLLKNYENDPIREYKLFYKLGVDGLFTDFPETALKALTSEPKSKTFN